MNSGGGGDDRVVLLAAARARVYGEITMNACYRNSCVLWGLCAVMNDGEDEEAYDNEQLCSMHVRALVGHVAMCWRSEHNTWAHKTLLHLILPGQLHHRQLVRGCKQHALTGFVPLHRGNRRQLVRHHSRDKTTDRVQAYLVVDVPDLHHLRGTERHPEVRGRRQLQLAIGVTFAGSDTRTVVSAASPLHLLRLSTR